MDAYSSSWLSRFSLQWFLKLVQWDFRGCYWHQFSVIICIQITLSKYFQLSFKPLNFFFSQFYFIPNPNSILIYTISLAFTSITHNHAAVLGFLHGEISLTLPWRKKLNHKLTLFAFLKNLLVCLSAFVN